MAQSEEFARLTKEQFDAYVFWGIDTENVDLANDTQRDQLLRKLLSEAVRLRLLHHGSASYFDPAAGAIVIDADVPIEHQLNSFKHEVAHLIASQNVFGATLRALSDLQDVLYKAYERPVLAAVSYVMGDMVEELFNFDLKQFKAEWSERGEEAIARHYRHHLLKNRQRVREVYEDGHFLSFRTSFQRVAERRRALVRSWRLYQEGFATYSEVDQFFDPVLARLGKQCFGLSQDELDTVFDAADKARIYKRQRLESSRTFMSSTYRKGYAIFQRLAAHGEENVYLASRFASHFPYQRCNLIDCSDSEFKTLLSSPVLNVDKRLQRLSEDPSVLAKASLDDQTTHRAVLEYILGSQIPDAVSASARCFDEWELTHIRGSQLVGNALEERGVPRGDGCSLGSSNDLRFHVEAGSPVESFGVFSSAGVLLFSENRRQGEVLIRRLHDMVWMDQIAMLLRQMDQVDSKSEKATVPELEVNHERSIAAINQELLALLESTPNDRAGMLDFATKHLRIDYVSAAATHDGSKLLVHARNSNEARGLIRIASLLGEVTFLDCGEYSSHRTVSILPIGDHIASPVLYASGQDDPETGRRRMGALTDVVLLMASLYRKREDGDGQPLGEFGVAPFSPDESWTITPYFRTAEEIRNELGEPCTVAVGITHLRIPKEDSFLDESRKLLRLGKLVYFPFPRTPKDIAQFVDTWSACKIHSGLLTTADLPFEGENVEVVADIEIPYVDSVYKTTCEVLCDSWDSFATLRRKVAKLSEQLQRFGVSPHTKSLIDSIKRECRSVNDILKDFAGKERVQTTPVTLLITPHGFHDKSDRFLVVWQVHQ